MKEKLSFLPKKNHLWFHCSHLECSAFNLIILFIRLVRLYSSSLYFQLFFFEDLKFMNLPLSEILAEVHQ